MMLLTRIKKGKHLLVSLLLIFGLSGMFVSQTHAVSKLEQIKAKLKALPKTLKGKLFKELNYNKPTFNFKIGKGILSAGLSFNFGFEGAGDPGNPFPNLSIGEGISTTGQWKLLKTGVNAIPVKEIKNFFAKIENMKPDTVFWFKVVSLMATAFKNRKNLAIHPNPKDVPLQLALLVIRLRGTTNPATNKKYTVRDMFKFLPAVLKKVLNELKIKNTTVFDFLNKFFKKLGKIYLYKFEGDPGYDAAKHFGKLTKGQAKDRLIAIALRIIRERKTAMANYVKTPQGKKEWDAYAAARKARDIKTIARAYSKLKLGTMNHTYQRKLRIGKKVINIGEEPSSLKSFLITELAKTAVATGAFWNKVKPAISGIAGIVGFDIGAVEQEILGAKKEITPPPAPPLALPEPEEFPDEDFGEDEGWGDEDED